MRDHLLSSVTRPRSYGGCARVLWCLCRERLRSWQQEYAAGLVESGLADWLRQRPLVVSPTTQHAPLPSRPATPALGPCVTRLRRQAVVGDALVVHGGIPLPTLERLAAIAAQRERTTAEMLQRMR